MSRLHAWIIKRDYFPDGEPGTYTNAVGLTGPRGATEESLTALAHGLGHKFRLLDDDGEVLYSGTFVGDCESEEGFAPLDDFGTPNAGCTEIQYWDGEEWNQL